MRIRSNRFQRALILSLLLPLLFIPAKALGTTRWAGFGSELKHDSGGTDTFVNMSLNSVFVSEPCQKPGPTTVLTDNTGDTIYGKQSDDIQSLSISEKLSGSGEPVLVFTLKVVNLQSISPYNSWEVTFATPSGGQRRKLELRSDGNSQLYFTTAFPPIIAGDLDPESNYSQDGTINFVVTRSKLNLVAGDTITNMKARTYRYGGEVDDFDDLAPDNFNAPSPASYTLGGNNPCTAPTPPLLLNQEGTNRAAALDAVTFVREPFPPTSNYFSSNQRTCIMLFAMNIDLQAGEGASAVTAQVEDSEHRIFPLAVEYVGKIPDFDWMTQVNVRLPDGLTSGGDMSVSLSYHGLESNKALISIKVP